MSAAPKMTVRQIASAARCHPDTVRDTAKKLFPELVQNGRKTEFDEAQAFEIMSALPKRNSVGALEKTEGDLRRNPKVLPSGAQLDALTRMVDRKILTPSNVQALLGLPTDPAPMGAGRAALLPAPAAHPSSVFKERKSEILAAFDPASKSIDVLLLQGLIPGGKEKMLRVDSIAVHFGIPCKRIQEIAQHLGIGFTASESEVARILTVLEAEEALH